VRSSDLTLMAAVGDRDAFAELYDRYGVRVYRLAHRIVRDARLAEDVTQEAFLTLWLQSPRFDASRSRPAAWLFTLAHRRAVDVVRREQLRQTETVDALAHLADGTDVHGDAWHSVQATTIRQAMSQLSDAQRAVIELAYFGGYSQAQLASHLGEPLGTIKSRTQAALANLRSLLAAHGLRDRIAFHAAG
jgi:RNA polymerase sigma factor (sigma-70 family)